MDDIALANNEQEAFSRIHELAHDELNFACIRVAQLVLLDF